MSHGVLSLGDRITLAPVIHGSADFALAVRQLMLEQRFECVAVPLPESFRADVRQAMESLPAPTVVLQRARRWFPDPADSGRPEVSESTTDFPCARSRPQGSETCGPDAVRGRETRAQRAWEAVERDDGDDLDAECSYVPVDPCQPVITALRIAAGERIATQFIDLETDRFEPHAGILPDPYALKQVAWERFAAAVLPAIPRPAEGQRLERIRHMARRLAELEKKYQSILFVCSLFDWPWIREAYHERARPGRNDSSEVEATEIYAVDPRTLIFLLGELPFITGLYERARSELEDDENLSIDGVKELLVEARDRYRRDLKRRARQITPYLLSQCLKYLRNLTLIERRLTPDLYSLVVASKQVAGDQFALHVAETARDYPIACSAPFLPLRMGIERARLPDGETVRMVSRLPGSPIVWRRCELQRRPERSEVEKWRMQWNPFSQCSWPPEDELIENFRAHVFDRAKSIVGADLARTEKFTTSVQDGVDFRETLRHWHEGGIYVKVLPPNRGRLDCVVMLFDAPADPRDYPWRTTWFAEHENESTLAFFATDFRSELVGPGIGVATYGGALFLFPPILVPDIWIDRRLDFTTTLEERLLGAACLHSRCPQIAVLSAQPPGAGWRRLARRFRRKFVHVPLGQFGDSTVQQLRMAHVLNGKQVRSYAAHFIRKA